VSDESFPSISGPTNTFGNGWFGRRPLLPASNPATSLPSQDGTRNGSTSFELVITLTVAYESLLGDTKSSTVFRLKIFRYALPFHSCEELLFNLRWFLGPGAPDIQSLAREMVGFDEFWTHTNSFPRAFGPSHILSPYVDSFSITNGG
jgi:hypothetical protein